MTAYQERIPEGVAYADGEYMPLRDLQVSIADLGFTQGAATYEVAHVTNDRIFRPDWHIERFLKSAEGLDLSLEHDEAALLGIMKECVNRSGFNNAFIWMGVTQGIPETGIPRDYDKCEPRFYAYAKELYGISGEKGMSQQAVSLAVSSVVRIPPQSVDPRYKNHHWLDLRRAQKEAHQNGYDTAVLVDRGGYITEGPGFNVCAVREGAIVTPVGTVLEGITRRAVQEIASELDIPFKLDRLTAWELRMAEEVFLTSTSGGITPVHSVDRLPGLDPKARTTTAAIQDAYRAKHSDPAWSVPVNA